MTDAQRIQSHRDLKVWQLGMDVAEDIYRLTQAFPKEELYGVTSQMRRAATSIPANIAEGNARGSTKEYLRHLSIAVASLAELETWLELSLRLKYGSERESQSLMDRIAEQRRMLRGLQRSLRARLKRRST